MADPYKYGVFASRLREGVEAAGLTQAELATRLGVKQQAVSKWMNGITRPRPEVLRQLATLVGWTDAQAFEFADYFEAGRDAVETRTPTVGERLAALEITVATQDRKLDEILALLRGGEEPR